MLDFFRRHQRYFFLVITVVIVLSFSFFGTYSTLSNQSFREQIAFTTVDGTEIPRHELDEMVAFISTDSQDKQLYGGAWGPNFLNSGVIKKDFLETGLAALLIAKYPDEVQKDLEKRFEKEKRFNLYSHPQAPFIGVSSVWNNFAPGMMQHFEMLRSLQDPLSPQAIQARIALILGEKELPANFMRQILRYQEKQQSWLAPDRGLDYADLSIFGYHTVEDWLGPRFVRLVAEFIINASTIAQKNGYQVSKADAMADLIRNSEISFQQNIRNPNLGVANGQEYFTEQLRRLGMDANKAVKLWQQVLLFQRYFHDMGNSVFIDPATFERIDAYALEGVEGELFQLPKVLRFNQFQSLQKFEFYLDAVSKRGKSEKEILALPTKFLSPAEVSKIYPELVQKRYFLEVASINKKDLQGKVGVKESWNWEVDDQNWEKLKKQFPILGIQEGQNREDRFAALDALDDKTRIRVDAFARAAIVENHPEWIDSALEESGKENMTVGLHEKGGYSPFDGLKNGQELIELLDTAPLTSQEDSELSPMQKEASKKLSRFTANQEILYRIRVIERAPSAEIMLFAEADQQGILGDLLETKLDTYYKKIREDNQEFQRDDKSWKPFSEVKNLVADKYFAKVLKAIKNSYAAAISPEKAPENMINDLAATLRLLNYVNDVREKLLENPAVVSEWTQPAKNASVSDQPFLQTAAIEDQWKLERVSYRTTRSSPNNLLDQSELFSLGENTWTKVQTPSSGDLNFFHLRRKINEMNHQAVVENITESRRLLSVDAQQRLMIMTLEEIKAKNAISLEYMNQVAETSGETEMSPEE